jgi:hypothetical protein
MPMRTAATANQAAAEARVGMDDLAARLEALLRRYVTEASKCKGVALESGTGLLLGCRDTFIRCVLQRRVCGLKRTDFFAGPLLPLGLFQCQFPPDRCWQVLGLLTLSRINPTPNLIGSFDRNRLVAVRALGWWRVSLGWRQAL